MNDQFYDLAFTCRKSRPWYSQYVSLLALDLPEIGRCYLYANDAHESWKEISLYRGDAGLQSLISYLRALQDDDTINIFMRQVQQDKVSCFYVGKTFFLDDLQPEIRDYGRRKGVRIGGVNAYPYAVRWKPNHYPQTLTDPAEQELLKEAMEALIWASAHEKQLPKLNAYLCHFSQMTLLKKIGDTYETEIITLPEVTDFIPVPDMAQLDAAFVKKTKKRRKNGTWCCRLMAASQTIENETPHERVYPYVFVVYDEDEDEIMTPLIGDETGNYDVANMLNMFMEMISEAKRCPDTIVIEDGFTFGMLESWCKKVGIELRRDYFLEEAEDVMQQAFLLSARVSDTSDDEEDLAAGTFIVRAAVRKNCYRDIQISSTETLDTLAIAILNAYEFDDDHLYAFFLSGKPYDQRSGIYRDGLQEGLPNTADYTLQDIEAGKGYPFLFLFDFGDDWMFQCQVIGTKEEKTLRPFVVNKKGKAPRQY